MISQAIGDMMSAEFTHLRDRNGNVLLPDTVKFSDWEHQVYLQSGSLLSKSCEAALELAGHEDNLKQAASEFGKNVAFARQVSFKYLIIRKNMF
jgi:decaprenyl-diphosphate synthase subunit 2